MDKPLLVLTLGLLVGAISGIYSGLYDIVFSSLVVLLFYIYLYEKDWWFVMSHVWRFSNEGVPTGVWLKNWSPLSLTMACQPCKDVWLSYQQDL